MKNNLEVTHPDPVRLRNVLMPHIQSGHWHVSLALTWLYMVHSGGPRLSALSIATIRDERFSDIVRLAEGLNQDRVAANIDPLLAAAPCHVLTVFDYLLTQPRLSLDDEAAPTSSFGVYHRANEVITLPAADLAALGIADFHQKVYLVEASSFSDRPRSAKQEIHPYHYTPHWWVVPTRLDDKPQGYSLEIGPVTTNLFGAFARANKTASRLLRVYVGEYIQFPTYVAKWADGASEKKLWMATGIRNEQAVGDEAIEHLRRAKADGADVVVLPELSSSPTMEARIIEWLEDENVRNDEQDHVIGMVVAGSRHSQTTTSDVFNVSMVFDRSGAEVSPLCQKKLTRVSLPNFRTGKKDADGKDMTVHVVEDISTDSRVGLLASPIGLHANVICLDLGQSVPTVKVPLELIPLSWLWVPSLSNNTDAHKKRAREICLTHPTRISCANQGPVWFDADRAADSESLFKAGCSFALTVDHDGTNEATAVGNDEAAGWRLFDFKT